MPKNCPLGKEDSHACRECGFSVGFDTCLAPALLETFELVSESQEKVRQQVANCECLDCFHFKICSRLMGGMDLVKCEDYISKSKVYYKRDDIRWLPLPGEDSIRW